MGRRSVLVWENSKVHRAVMCSPGCELPDTSINQGLEVMTKFYIMFTEFFKELDQIYDFPVVSTPRKTGKCPHKLHTNMVTDMEYRNSERKEYTFLLLI